VGEDDAVRPSFPGGQSLLMHVLLSVNSCGTGASMTRHQLTTAHDLGLSLEEANRSELVVRGQWAHKQANSAGLAISVSLCTVLIVGSPEDGADAQLARRSRFPHRQLLTQGPCKYLSLGAPITCSKPHTFYVLHVLTLQACCRPCISICHAALSLPAAAHHPHV